LGVGLGLGLGLGLGVRVRVSVRVNFCEHTVMPRSAGSSLTVL